MGAHDSARRAAIACAAILIAVAIGCEEEESTVVPKPRFSAVADTSFAVAPSCSLVVDNFVGSVELHPGDDDTLRIAMTRWAERESDLDDITIDFSENQGCMRIVTDAPEEAQNPAIDLVMSGPPGLTPVFTNGVGGTTYQGRAPGSCRFENVVGSLTLILPADVNVTVALTVGTGSIDVDFPVNGQVGQHAVNGTIGTGEEGVIEGHVGVGSIRVQRQPLRF